VTFLGILAIAFALSFAVEWRTGRGTVATLVPVACFAALVLLTSSQSLGDQLFVLVMAVMLGAFGGGWGVFSARALKRRRDTTTQTLGRESRMLTLAKVELYSRFKGDMDNLSRGGLDAFAATVTDDEPTMSSMCRCRTFLVEPKLCYSEGTPTICSTLTGQVWRRAVQEAPANCDLRRFSIGCPSTSFRAERSPRDGMHRDLTRLRRQSVPYEMDLTVPCSWSPVPR
jgi:hypothetical protein